MTFLNFCIMLAAGMGLLFFAGLLLLGLCILLGNLSVKIFTGWWPR